MSKKISEGKPPHPHRREEEGEGKGKERRDVGKGKRRDLVQWSAPPLNLNQIYATECLLLFGTKL